MRQVGQDNTVRTHGLHRKSTEPKLGFRRTRDGNIVLFVVNDRGQLRSYRLDRIAGVRPTSESFAPVFRVEF
ncbi:hypothetical protein AB0L70_40620 [Kribbella sp. NPDC051952]|uniref:hypothetical protein n=1 Tax=Kribbella sp. NPDC051952 TaxID=3154851 RepID=UPI00343C3EC2